MATCKKCVSEKVCRYNDGFNLYCKEDYECPHFKSTADVGEVVRCKGCQYWDEVDGRCDPPRNGLTIEYTHPEDFCSYGERKETGDDQTERKAD